MTRGPQTCALPTPGLTHQQSKPKKLQAGFLAYPSPGNHFLFLSQKSRGNLFTNFRKHFGLKTFRVVSFSIFQSWLYSVDGSYTGAWASLCSESLTPSLRCSSPNLPGLVKFPWLQPCCSLYLKYTSLEYHHDQAILEFFCLMLYLVPYTMSSLSSSNRTHSYLFTQRLPECQAYSGCSINVNRTNQWV